MAEEGWAVAWPGFWLCTVYVSTIGLYINS